MVYLNKNIKFLIFLKNTCVKELGKYFRMMIHCKYLIICTIIYVEPKVPGFRHTRASCNIFFEGLFLIEFHSFKKMQTMWIEKNYRQNWEDFWEKFREIIAKIENIFAKIPNANPTKKLKKLHNFQINHSFFWYHCTQHILLSHKIVTAQNRVLIFIYIYR